MGKIKRNFNDISEEIEDSMREIWNLYRKYKGIISYLFFGVCTTLINMIIYQLCYQSLQISNIVSTIIAWILAVLFAFVTNKMFVFESKSWVMKVLRHELLSFFGCRLLTGILDVVVMFIAVDIFAWNALLWKLLSNILVIVLNYIASKFLIFKK